MSSPIRFSVSGGVLLSHLSRIYTSAFEISSKVSSTGSLSSELVDDCLVVETLILATDNLFFQGSEPSLPILLTAITSIRLSLIAGRPITFPQRNSLSQRLSSYHRFLLDIFPYELMMTSGGFSSLS